MAYSFNEVLATGVAQLIAVPEYIDQSHIKVRVNGVDTSSFSWVNANTVSVTAVAGATVRVYRDSSPAARLVDYVDGASLTEAALDADSKQAFFLMQEQLDRTADTFALAASLTTALGSALTYSQNSADSAAAAAISAASSAASFDSFDDHYLGAKAADPTLDNDGNALVLGALYFNTTSAQLRIWTGAAWAVAATTVSTFIATLLDDTTAAQARGTLGLTNTVVNRAYAEYTTNADLSAIIPLDDTIPQNTEGTQILSVTITPKSTASRIRVRFQAQFIAAGGGVGAIAALFWNTNVGAVRSGYNTNSGAGFSSSLAFEFEHVPGSTSVQTYAVRVGSQSATVIRLNGSGAGRLLGGTLAATLVVEEIA